MHRALYRRGKLARTNIQLLGGFVSRKRNLLKFSLSASLLWSAISTRTQLLGESPLYTDTLTGRVATLHGHSYRESRHQLYTDTATGRVATLEYRRAGKYQRGEDQSRTQIGYIPPIYCLQCSVGQGLKYMSIAQCIMGDQRTYRLSVLLSCFRLFFPPKIFYTKMLHGVFPIPLLTRPKTLYYHIFSCISFLLILCPLLAPN